MAQTPPDKPAWLTDAEWQYILNRDAHQCALYPICVAQGLLGQTDYCSTKLDVDHEQPKTLGGDDSWTNARLMCEGPNRGRPDEAAPRWASANIWDDPIDLGRLRDVQRIAGYDSVTDPDVIPCLTEREYRNQLLKRITLIPGVTGIGKAIMMLSILFGINHSVGVGRPRVRKILWLATDQTLRDLAVTELENDIYDKRIATHRAPSAVSFDKYTDFLRGPGDHDICVSCPQILWEVDKDGRPRRSENEVRDALKWFDAVVFDEGDWARDQVRRIAMIASHALKFALTASLPSLENMETKEREALLRTFVLISEEAIADYQTAVDIDACVKWIDPLLSIVIGAEHDEYEAFVRGQRSNFNGEAAPDHPSFLAIILQAIHDADRLESQMRALSPDRFFSPHIIARFSRIEDVIAAHVALTQMLPNRALQNDGWLTTPIFQGHMQNKRLRLTPDEADLSARRQGKWRHPFFRAKNFGGVADRLCRRVLLMCNIGVRGINNWPILFAVDCVEAPSRTEQIQFDWGRPIRLPDEFSDFIDNERFRQFVTLKVYVPKVQGWKDKSQGLDDTRDFIVNMKTKVAGYGFHTWKDIIAGRRPEDMPRPNITPQAPPFTMTDKIALQNGMGQTLAVGGKLDDAGEIERILDKLIPKATGERRERAKVYIEGLRDKPEFRKDELLAVQVKRETQINPEVVLTRLKPQGSYSDQTLLRYVMQDARFAATRQQYVNELNTGSVVARHALSEMLHDAQTVNYREPPRIWRLQGSNKPGDDERGVLRIVANELSQMLIKAGALDTKDTGKVQAVFFSVATEFFGVTDAREGGDMDHHAYHVAILGRCRRKLQALTRARLTQDGTLTNIARLASV